LATSGDELTLCVRISSEEAGKGNVTVFKLQSRHFVLVRGAADQLRERCHEPHLSLEVSPQELRKAAKQLLDGEAHVVFVTASEGTETGARVPKAGKAAVTKDSDSE